MSACSEKDSENGSDEANSISFRICCIDDRICCAIKQKM